MAENMLAGLRDELDDQSANAKQGNGGFLMGAYSKIVETCQRVASIFRRRS